MTWRRTIITAARREGHDRLAAAAWLARRQGRHAFADSLDALILTAFAH